MAIWPRPQMSNIAPDVHSDDQVLYGVKYIYLLLLNNQMSKQKLVRVHLGK